MQSFLSSARATKLLTTVVLPHGPAGIKLTSNCSSLENKLNPAITLPLLKLVSAETPKDKDAATPVDKEVNALPVIAAVPHAFAPDVMPVG